MGRQHVLGKEGEDHAVLLLEQKGYVILERNYRFKRAEVDIIARDGKYIVFVEVKARSNRSHGFPEDAITKKKVNLLARAASHYMYVNKLESFIRFDVVALERNSRGWDSLHTEDAFFPET